MASIIWTITARNDLKNIFDYISKDSAYYARTFIKKIKYETKKIKSNPNIGRFVPEYNQKDLRELIFQNYRIIYKLESNKIIIVTIFHAARDLSQYNIDDWR